MKAIFALALFAGFVSAQDTPALNNQKEKVSYALGIDLGRQLRNASVDVDPAVFEQGLQDALSGGRTLLTEAQVRAAISELQADLKKKEYANRRKSPGENDAELKLLAQYNKSAGDAFLAANKKKEGVVALPGGLQYRVLKAGAGPKPKPFDTVKCNYKAAPLNGKEFFNTFASRQPATMKVDGVLKGLSEALQLMPVGSRWEIVLPPGTRFRGCRRGTDRSRRHVDLRGRTDRDPVIAG